MSEALGLLIAEVEALKRSLERTAVVEYPVGGGGGAPANAQYVVLALNAGLSQERVLTGTANQIVITDNGAGSTVVLSTPQNIDTAATPTFAGMTLTGLGAGATDAVVTLSAGDVLEQRAIDARVWGSSLVDGSGAAGRVAYWLDGDTLTSDADFTFDGAQLVLAVQGSSGGLLVGGDVQWYRTAANRWRTPDSVEIDGALGLGLDPNNVPTAKLISFHADSNVDLRALWASARAINSTTTNVFGLEFSGHALAWGSNTAVTELRGLSGTLVAYADTGLATTVDNAIALRAATPSYTVDGTGTVSVTFSEGLHIGDFGHGTHVGTAYGLYIESQTPSVSAAYAIYTNEGDLRFGGSSSTKVGFRGATPVAAQTYTVSNLTTDRTYDANSTSTAELADVLGTLISDLRNQGLVA